MPGSDEHVIDEKKLKKMPIEAQQPEITGDQALMGRPREREAEEGDAPLRPGFTQTGLSGSAGGRSLYGMNETDTHEPTDVENASDTEGDSRH